MRYPPSAASARLLKQLADFNPSGSGDSSRNALLPNEHDAKERGEAWRLPEGGCPADLMGAPASGHPDGEAADGVLGERCDESVERYASSDGVGSSDSHLPLGKEGTLGSSDRHPQYDGRTYDRRSSHAGRGDESRVYGDSRPYAPLGGGAMDVGGGFGGGGFGGGAFGDDDGDDGGGGGPSLCTLRRDVSLNAVDALRVMGTLGGAANGGMRPPSLGSVRSTCEPNGAPSSLADSPERRGGGGSLRGLGGPSIGSLDEADASPLFVLDASAIADPHSLESLDGEPHAALRASRTVSLDSTRLGLGGRPRSLDHSLDGGSGSASREEVMMIHQAHEESLVSALGGAGGAIHLGGDDMLVSSGAREAPEAADPAHMSAADVEMTDVDVGADLSADAERDAERSSAATGADEAAGGAGGGVLDPSSALDVDGDDAYACAAPKGDGADAPTLPDACGRADVVA